MTDRHSSQSAIVTTDLTKRYAAVTALDSLSLTVETGSITGFLGPNGAGKTTTIKMLLGFVRSSRGAASIFGHDVWSDGVVARREIGYLVPAEAFYPEMNGISQLDLAARLSGRDPVLRERLLDLLELARQDLERKLGEYSRGMRQKLALIAAAQHDPPLLILDEPTEGLDPLIQRRFESFVREFHARGRTVFMSSHDLREVERLCDDVAIVREGRLVAHESIESIRRLQTWSVEVRFAGEAPHDLRTLEGVHIRSDNGADLVLTVDRSLNPLLNVLATAHVDSLTITPPGLDDVFLSYYGASPPVWSLSSHDAQELPEGQRDR